MTLIPCHGPFIKNGMKHPQKCKDYADSVMVQHTDLTPSLVSSGGTEKVDCTACGNPIDGPTVYPLCSHPFCVGCFQNRIEIAADDESAFPPKCCGTNGNFSFLRDFKYLDPDVAQKFASKRPEYLTTDRVYCHNRVCSAFLGAALTRIAAYECKKCDQWTCGHCKGPGHSSSIGCSTDPKDEDILELATREGWQQCLSCNSLVQLAFGCNHMTCRCGFEFCYVCAKQWKTCDCPQWDEQELQAAQLRDPEAWRNGQEGNVLAGWIPGGPLAWNAFPQRPLHPPVFAPQPPRFMNARWMFPAVPEDHPGFVPWDAPPERTWVAAHAAPIVPEHVQPGPHPARAATDPDEAESSTSRQQGCTHGPWTRVPDAELRTSADSVCIECRLRGANDMHVSLPEPVTLNPLTAYRSLQICLGCDALFCGQCRQGHHVRRTWRTVRRKHQS